MFLAFVQFELPGRIGLADGRYLIRADPEQAAEEVLVVNVHGAPRRRRRSRTRVRTTETDPGPAALPATRVTVVRAEGLGEAPDAARWLERIVGEGEERDAFVADGLATLNQALHVHRAATLDPYVTEVSERSLAAIRIGYGSGDQLAEGHWSEAQEVERTERRPRRDEALRPQERLAAVLGGRDRIDACETLILRARLDLDQGRSREAALQLRVGLEALLADSARFSGPGQKKDIAALEACRRQTGEVANEALRGELSGARIDELGETLTVCERILRRRQVLRE